jgi:hypothetical protein
MLEGPGIKCRWRRSRPAVGPTRSPVKFYRVFLGGKRPGRGIDHLPPFCSAVKEGVHLYLYSPSGPSCPVLGQSLPFICTDDMHRTPARSPFVGETFLFYLRTQFLPRSKLRPRLLHKTNMLMLHKAKVAVCSESHTQHVSVSTM